MAELVSPSSTCSVWAAPMWHELQVPSSAAGCPTLVTHMSHMFHTPEPQLHLA